MGIRYFAKYVAGGLVAAATVFGGARSVMAQYPAYPAMPPGGPGLPGYPYYNPQVAGGRFYELGTFNPWTGTWATNVHDYSIRKSAYQPGREVPLPGTVQRRYDATPDGGYEYGTVWRDIYGNPHADMTHATPNPYGGYYLRTEKVMKIVTAGEAAADATPTEAAPAPED